MLIIISAGCGIFIKDTYVHETENWRTQAIAQDIIDLLLSARIDYYGHSFAEKKTHCSTTGSASSCILHINGYKYWSIGDYNVKEWNWHTINDLTTPNG